VKETDYCPKTKNGWELEAKIRKTPCRAVHIVKGEKCVLVEKGGIVPGVVKKNWRKMICLGAKGLLHVGKESKKIGSTGQRHIGSKTGEGAARLV